MIESDCKNISQLPGILWKACSHLIHIESSQIIKKCLFGVLFFYVDIDNKLMVCFHCVLFLHGTFIFLNILFEIHNHYTYKFSFWDVQFVSFNQVNEQKDIWQLLQKCGLIPLWVSLKCFLVSFLVLKVCIQKSHLFFVMSIGSPGILFRL